MREVNENVLSVLEKKTQTKWDSLTHSMNV